MCVGDRAAEQLSAWADEIADLVTAHGGKGAKLAVDRIEPDGAFALQDRGLEIIDDGQVTELARALKSADALDHTRLRGGHGPHI
ncbi:MAG: hypothetical protein ABF283_15450 [Planktotalea arctica]